MEPGCLCRRLEARAYAHATEDLDRVVEAVRNVAPGGRIAVAKARGHHGNEIAVVTAEVEGCEASDALKYILNNLDEIEFNIFINSININKNRLYIRINKQKALSGVLRLDEGDDVVVVEARVASRDFNKLIDFLRSARGR